MPARVSDDDPRCCLSSLQKFQGEDLNSRSRKKYQQEQLPADRLFYAKQNELGQRSMELQRAEEECRKAINESIKNYNDALYRETQERQNPDQAISQFGPHRIVPDRWKGMNEDQIRRIREEQQHQIEEKKRRNEEEQQHEDELNRRRIAEAKVGMIVEKNLERERRTFEHDLYNDNQRLANEQRNLKAYLDRVIYTNQPTAAYFMQFNTSSR
ncbi:unnamed protein product [Rotaria sordida]|uniref:RIB43A-like with coiled-coils protein 2 n=2 Tax=Rotaria sordida TaxID=392033 RepID=A0A815SK61_9BILA|nr:unnamed protein product [Rotaria sordida]